MPQTIYHSVTHLRNINIIMLLKHIVKMNEI